MFNDQNIHYSYISSLCKFNSAADDDLWPKFRRILCFVRLRRMGHWDFFEIWYLVLENLLQLQSIYFARYRASNPALEV